MLSRSSATLIEKYGFRPTGSGGALRVDVKSLSLSFEVDGRRTTEEARRLILDAVDVMVREMNSNESDSQYLNIYPATHEQVSVMVAFADGMGGYFWEPDICMVSYSYGTVTYFTVNVENPLGYKKQLVETFEEAVAKVNKAAG